MPKSTQPKKGLPLLSSLTWSLHSLANRLRNATPEQQTKALHELDGIRQRVDAIHSTLPNGSTPKGKAMQRCKEIGDRLLAENRPPSQTELAEIETLSEAIYPKRN